MDSELFVPKNLLENCQGLQELIAHAPPDEKDRAGFHAKDMIEPGQLHYHDSKKLEIRTLGAYALPDGLTLESELWPVVRYGELQLGGRLAQVSYMRLQRLTTLAWMIVDPIIRRNLGALHASAVDPSHNSEEMLPTPVGTRLTRPLYLPVGMIESVFVGAE
jgi:hypothetical protein